MIILIRPLIMFLLGVFLDSLNIGSVESSFTGGNRLKTGFKIR